MKSARYAMRALALVTLVGCSRAAPASPVAPPSAPEALPSAVAAAPTRASPSTMMQTREDGFAIYLLAQDIPPEQLAILSHLELATEPVLSMRDIVTYTQTTHEIGLTAAGYARLRGLAPPTRGRAFAVCVHGEPIYSGAFWAAYSSQSFDGVIIDPFYATDEHRVIQIQLGYPGPAFFRGHDPRSDPRIWQALEQAGKLRR